MCNSFRDVQPHICVLWKFIHGIKNKQMSKENKNAGNQSGSTAPVAKEQEKNKGQNQKESEKSKDRSSEKKPSFKK